MNNELRMPALYVDMQEDEMMYLDGGAEVRWRWWGNQSIMSALESKNMQNILNKLATGSTTGGVGTGFLSLGISTQIAGLGARYASELSNSLSQNTTANGVVLSVTWALRFWSKGR